MEQKHQAEGLLADAADLRKRASELADAADALIKQAAELNAKADALSERAQRRGVRKGTGI